MNTNKHFWKIISTLPASRCGHSSCIRKWTASKCCWLFFIPTSGLWLWESEAAAEWNMCHVQWKPNSQNAPIRSLNNPSSSWCWPWKIVNGIFNICLCCGLLLCCVLYIQSIVSKCASKMRNIQLLLSNLIEFYFVRCILALQRFFFCLFFHLICINFRNVLMVNNTWGCTKEQCHQIHTCKEKKDIRFSIWTFNSFIYSHYLKKKQIFPMDYFVVIVMSCCAISNLLILFFMVWSKLFYSPNIKSSTHSEWGSLKYFV